MRRALTCLLLAVVLVHGVALAGGKEEAEKHFEKGVDLFKNEDYEGALVEFNAAYEAEPHFAVLYNVSICLYRLHDYAASVGIMRTYLAEGGDDIPPERREEIEGILAEIEDLVGVLEIDCSPGGAEVEVDGRSIGSCPVSDPVYLKVGTHEIVVSTPGFDPGTRTVALPGGSTKRVTIALSPGKETLRGARKVVPAPVFWTLAGLTLAAAGASAVTGGLALKAESDYRKLDWYDEWEDAQGRARSLALGASILWGVTGVLGVTTLVIAFFTRFRNPGTEKPVLGLLVSANGMCLTLGGRF